MIINILKEGREEPGGSKKERRGKGIKNKKFSRRIKWFQGKK